MAQQGDLRHFLGGTATEEPFGWGDFTEVLERDPKARLIGVKYPVDLTFVGAAYELLTLEYEEDPCQVLDYRADQYLDGQWWQVAQGNVFLSDIEWDLSKRQAKVSVTDDSIGARILSNRRLVVFPDATESKNGEAITATPSIDLEVFDPQDPLGTYLASTRRAYDWLECMKHLVQFLSDGTVTVVSDWYDALPDDERWALLDGDELRTHDQDEQRLSYNWESLLRSLGTVYDLWAAVERDDDGDPVIRIEPTSYWQGTTVAASYPYTDELVRTVDQDLLYAKVLIGSDAAIKDVTSSYSLPFLILRGFTKEDITLRTVCNTDAELDLTSDWVFDSNTIEAVIAGDADYDEEVFVIQYDHTTDKATKGDYLNPSALPYLYNEQALNINVLNRYTLPADAVVVTGDNTLEGFQATYTLGPTTPVSYALNPWSIFGAVSSEQVRFDDDYNAPNYDTANAYGNGTVQGNSVSQANSRYTAASQGYAAFEVFIPFQALQSNNGQFGNRYALNIGWRHKDSGGNIIAQGQRLTTAQAAQEHLGSGVFNVTWAFGVNMNATDYVEVYAGLSIGFPDVSTLPVTLSILGGAYWKTTATATGGGVVTSADPGAYYGTVYKFDRHITNEQWTSLRSDQSQRIEVGPDAATVFGYVRKAERNVKTGACTWEIIANRSQE